MADGARKARQKRKEDRAEVESGGAEVEEGRRERGWRRKKVGKKEDMKVNKGIIGRDAALLLDTDYRTDPHPSNLKLPPKRGLPQQTVVRLESTVAIDRFEEMANQFIAIFVIALLEVKYC